MLVDPENHCCSCMHRVVVPSLCSTPEIVVAILDGVVVVVAPVVVVVVVVVPGRVD